MTISNWLPRCGFWAWSYGRFWRLICTVQAFASRRFLLHYFNGSSVGGIGRSREVGRFSDIYSYIYRKSQLTWIESLLASLTQLYEQANLNYLYCLYTDSRTGLHINKQEVLSACLKEDGLSLQHPILTIQKAIDDLNGSETKDFIKPQAKEMKISRKKWFAANIYLATTC